MDAVQKQPAQHAWTASRTSYTWRAGGATLGYSHHGSFSNGDSGIVVGTDSNHKLQGAVIYNSDNTTTWPDSSHTTSEGVGVAFEAAAVAELPGYHYKFTT